MPKPNAAPVQKPRVAAAGTKSSKKRAKKKTATAASQAPPAPPPPAPLGDNPFAGHFDVSYGADDDVPDAMRQSVLDACNAQRNAPIDVMGDLCVTLDIEFHEEASARKPISPALYNERIDEGAAIESIGWSQPYVMEDTKSDYLEKLSQGYKQDDKQDDKPDEEEDSDEDDDEALMAREPSELDEEERAKMEREERAAVEASARVVLEDCKYILVQPDRPQGAARRCYGREDKTWRVRDVMTAILDTERHVRPQTEWFGGVDAHHTHLDCVDCVNGVVSYHFGS